MNKEKAKKLLLKAENSALTGGATALGVTAMSVVSIGMATAMAAGSTPEALVQLIIKLLGALIMVMGGIFAILGLVHYASAHSEGDGPAKTKAIGQIAAGVMLVVMSIVLTTNATQIATAITPTVTF